MSTVPDLATLDDLMAHAGWTRALAVRLLGDLDEAEDVVQETWLSALRLPPQRRRPLRPWIATVVRNLVRSRARSDTRARRRAQQLASAATVPSSEDLLSQLQTERTIAALVLELPEPYRHTVILRYHHGRSAADIARAEEIPEGTVRWRLKYGLDELRRRFDERAGGRDVARSVLLPFAAAATAVTAAKGALAAPLLFSGKALVATAPLAVVAVGGNSVLDPPRPSPPVATRAAKQPRPPRRPVTPSGPMTAMASMASVSSSSTTPAATSLSPPPADASLFTPATPPPPAASTTPAPAPTSTTSRSSIAVNGRGGGGSGSRLVDLPAGRFVVTAELPENARGRVTIDVDARNGTGTVRWKVSPRAAHDQMVISVRPVSSPPLRTVSARASLEAANIQSRWCCRRVVVVGDYVEGRACLRLPETSSGRECEPYGLQREVHCQDDTFGNFASGDLRRTGRLVCEGSAL